MGARKARKKEKATRKTTGCGAWPNYNDNMGVGTHQIHDAMAESRRIGVPTEFCPDTGRAIFTSARHRKRYAEAMGYKVVGGRGAGLSDPVSLSQREKENRGYTDTNRLRIPAGQAKYSANWCLAFGKGKYD